jgi:hypothetical protein
LYVSPSTKVSTLLRGYVSTISYRHGNVVPEESIKCGEKYEPRKGGHLS